MHRATQRPAPEVGPIAATGERLRVYAARIRRAKSTGHRLNFTADEVLDAIQQACRHCTNALLDVQASTDKEEETLKDVAGLQKQICDTIQALRERMLFAPL